MRRALRARTPRRNHEGSRGRTHEEGPEVAAAGRRALWAPRQHNSKKFSEVVDNPFAGGYYMQSALALKSVDA